MNSHPTPYFYAGTEGVLGRTKYGSVARFRAGSATIGSGVLRLRVLKASPDMSVRLRKVPNPPGHNRGLGSQRSCVLHTRDVRSAQPLAERMTLQPVVTRDDPTYKTDRQARDTQCVHTYMCMCCRARDSHTRAPPHHFAPPPLGTLSPLLPWRRT